MSETLVSNGEFSGSSYRLTSVKLYDRPWLPWQRNLTQNWLGPITLPSHPMPLQFLLLFPTTWDPRPRPVPRTIILSLRTIQEQRQHPCPFPCLLPSKLYFLSVLFLSLRHEVALRLHVFQFLYYFFYFVQQYNISFILFRCEEMTINI